ncbi:MAG: antibiotic biosynthesis monooxygenase [Lentimicrobium sp.]
MIANTPHPPYYAVIFSSVRTEGDNGYSDMAGKMAELAESQDGFFGMESVRDELGITVSYWRDLESVRKWRENLEHTFARNQGRAQWYKAFKVRICKVEADYDFVK